MTATSWPTRTTAETAGRSRAPTRARRATLAPDPPDRRRRQPAAGDPRARRLDAEPRRARAGPAAAAAGQRRHVGRLDRRGRRRARAVHPRRRQPAPGARHRRRRCRTTTRASPTTRCGRCTTTRCATRRTTAPTGTAYQTVNQRFADTLAEVAPDERDRVDPRLPPAARARRCCATSGPTSSSASSSTSRSRRSSCSCGCRGAPRSPPGSPAATSSASSGRSTPPTSTSCATSCSGAAPRVGSYPISIDVDELEAVAAGRATRQRSNRYRTRLGEPEVVLLGVDRLDYTKGISQRLRAYQSLLDDGTLDTERCVMVQVATPTREGVEHYQNERREIEQLVSEINGVHGRLGYPAIHYLYQSLPLDELVALYRTGDVMLVTPLRDGMNLVAKEYVTTRLDGDGVLVLSEFAGAADELTDAVLVNPHDERGAARGDRHRRRDAPPRAPGADGPPARGRARQRRADVGRALPRRPHRPRRASGDGARRTSTTRRASPRTARDAGRGRCSSGSTSTACWRRSSPTPTTPRCCPGCSTPSPSWPTSHAGRRRVRPHRRGPRPLRVPRPRRDLRAARHGAARRAHGRARPTTSRRGCERLAALAADAADQAGDGAWVEVKPASVVLHVREAQPEHGARSAAELQRQAEDVTGAHVLPGHGVVELLTRATSKAMAIAELRAELGGARRRVRRRRPHRRGGVRGDRRRRLLDPRRPRRRPPPATASPARPRCSRSSSALGQPLSHPSVADATCCRQAPTTTDATRMRQNRVGCSGR